MLEDTEICPQIFDGQETTKDQGSSRKISYENSISDKDEEAKASVSESERANDQDSV